MTTSVAGNIAAPRPHATVDEAAAAAVLDALPFAPPGLGALPMDADRTVVSREVRGVYGSWVTPTPVAAPRTLAVWEEVAALLGIPTSVCGSQQFAEIFGGNRLTSGMAPHAMCYGGHQFGNWAGQLGDGRAITLGHLRTPETGTWELQLKGAGPTPYSRRADGRAVLRSSVREFLCSEAKHHLGVPTTRALSLVQTGDLVVRDMFYDGNAQAEPGAIVCRVAPSFLRFGSYQLPASRGELSLLQQLVDLTISRWFPELGAPSEATYIAWVTEVAVRTAHLIVEWMRVGFVHGVMNTDNMSILGLTIDYGPYGWIDNFDLGWTPNTTDAAGRRYRFGNQLQIGLWNVAQLARAIAPLVQDAGALEGALDAYRDAVESGQRKMFAQKLGWTAGHGDADDARFEGMMETLLRVETDMTVFFRRLALLDPAGLPADDVALLGPISASWYHADRVGAADRSAIADWIRQWGARAASDGRPHIARAAAMNAVNPVYVLRNYLAQQAIDAATQGDLGPLHRLQQVLRRPYEAQAGAEDLAGLRPEWARHKAGCSMLSCSS